MRLYHPIQKNIYIRMILFYFYLVAYVDTFFLMNQWFDQHPEIAIEVNEYLASLSKSPIYASKHILSLIPQDAPLFQNNERLYTELQKRVRLPASYRFFRERKRPNRKQVTLHSIQDRSTKICIYECDKFRPTIVHFFLFKVALSLPLDLNTALFLEQTNKECCMYFVNDPNKFRLVRFQSIRCSEFPSIFQLEDVLMGMGEYIEEEKDLFLQTHRVTINNCSVYKEHVRNFAHALLSPSLRINGLYLYDQLHKKNWEPFTNILSRAPSIKSLHIKNPFLKWSKISSLVNSVAHNNYIMVFCISVKYQKDHNVMVRKCILDASHSEVVQNTQTIQKRSSVTLFFSDIHNTLSETLVHIVKKDDDLENTRKRRRMTV